MIKFFPANCTSELQSMDQGIIKNLKTGYRKRLLRRVIAKIDSCETGDELFKSVNVLDAIYWVAQAWQDVTQETIQKCYARSGFEFFEGFESFETPESTDQLNSLLKDLATITETESCTTEEYVNIESGNQVHTLESTDWEAELHSCINDEDITLDETSQDLPEPSVPSDKDVIRAFEVLKLYAFHNPSVLGSIISTESVVYGHIVEKRCHMSQKCLTEFFKV